MPKYLIQASFTQEGLKGLLKEGGSGRRRAVDQLAKSIGGKVEAFYFAFGETDVFVIMEAPDNASIAAASLAVSAAGAVRTRTVVLITPEEMDQAVEKSSSVAYRPPGERTRQRRGG